MKVLFMVGFGPIVRDMATSRAFYEETLGLQMEGEDDYRHTGAVDGVKHFALWRLEDAAESCFGARTWPADLPVPQGWLELDVQDMEAAVAELQSRGYHLLVAGRKEPWGQTVSRLLSPEGLLLGVTITPSMRGDA